MYARERQIEIEQVFVEFIEDFDITEYPISIQKVAEAADIGLVPYSKLDAKTLALARSLSRDAFNLSTFDYGMCKIAYNDNPIYRRRSRFSCAHEIGHILLEHGPNDYAREREADYLAGYMLIPHPLLLEYNSRRGVAHRFDTSDDCASFAIDQAFSRRAEGAPWRQHERWLIDNITWRRGDCLAIA